MTPHTNGLIVAAIFLAGFVGFVVVSVADVLTGGRVFDWVAFHLTGNYWYHHGDE